MGVPGGQELIGIVDSTYLGKPSLRQAREDLVRSLNPESLFDAATVFGNFEMMNRVAEGTGIGVTPQRLEREADMVEGLGLERLMKNQQRG